MRRHPFSPALGTSPLPRRRGRPRRCLSRPEKEKRLRPHIAMHILPITFWIAAGLLILALLANLAFPPLAVALGTLAALLILWLLLGGK